MKDKNSDIKLDLCGAFTARYAIKNAEAPRDATLLLHGYSQSGERFIKLVESALPKDTLIIAPNGPFPVPVILEGEMRIGFSWYFYEAEIDEYYIDMKIAQDYLTTLLNRLDLRLPVTRIIGYSQGGYLAPFVAQKCPSVKQVVGVACEFLESEISGPIHFRMDAVHGSNDEIVNLENSQKSFEKLKARGVQGDYAVIPKSAHKISTEILDQIKKFIR